MRQSGFDFRKFEKFRKTILQGGRPGVSRNAYNQVFKTWGVRYLVWTKRLFIRASRGGGDWPALKPSTIAGRRAGRSRRPKRRGRGYTKRGPTGRVSILRDTGTLLRALTPNMPGNLFKFISGGVRVGFGGPAKHPEGKATIADIAKFHNVGEGKLPKRQILFVPGNAFTMEMFLDLKRAIEKFGRSL